MCQDYGEKSHGLSVERREKSFHWQLKRIRRTGQPHMFIPVIGQPIFGNSTAEKCRAPQDRILERSASLLPTLDVVCKMIDAHTLFSVATQFIQIAA